MGTSPLPLLCCPRPPAAPRRRRRRSGGKDEAATAGTPARHRSFPLLRHPGVRPSQRHKSCGSLRGGTRGRRGDPRPRSKGQVAGGGGGANKKALLRGRGKRELRAAWADGDGKDVKFEGSGASGGGVPERTAEAGGGARMPHHGTPVPHAASAPFLPGWARGPGPGEGRPVPAARRAAGRQHPRGRASLAAAAAPASRPGPAGTCPGCLLPSLGGEPAALPAYRPVP